MSVDWITTDEAAEIVGVTALGFGDERAHSALRISVGRFNTDEQVETAVDRIIAAVQELKILGKYASPGTG